MEQHQLEALLQPATYPEQTSSVTLLQTHISYLFLTDAYVYKIKKPVNFGFLDFTTIGKRRFFCNEELRLNRRLSQDMYLGVVELRQDKNGKLSFDGKGKTIDYAVKMVRLPEKRMMSRLLEEGAVTSADIDAIARLVARFHGDAARSPEIDRFGAVDMIRANWDENLRQAVPYLGRTLSTQTHEQIGSWVGMRLKLDDELLRSRVADGFIRECDGDLHSENICLDSRIHIFDCIEFNEKFRFSDTAADVAFMVMDLENHGRRDLAEQFIAEYVTASGDGKLKEVLPLYLSNRAFIRGKVESFRLDDPGIPAADKSAAATRAKRFFRLSRGYTLREKLPLSMIITCAPTGCGKSSLAAELAFQLGIDHLSSDVERKRLAGLSLWERGKDIYTSDWNKRTYEQLVNLAREKLIAGRSVMVDGTFIRRSNRNSFSALAAAIGCDLIILKLNCASELAKKRLESRANEGRSISDGNWEIYEKQSSLLEEPESEEGILIELDAALSTEHMVDQALECLGII